MRAILRVMLLVAGLLGGFAFLAAYGRSELSPGGWTTVATIGAVDPWFEYERNPQQWNYQINILSWSMLFGFASALCFWLRSRLPSTSPSQATPIDQTAPAVQTGSVEETKRHATGNASPGNL